MLVTLLSENGRSANLANTYRSATTPESKNRYVHDSNKATVNELQKRAHTGNFLAGAQGGLNPGFFK